MRDKVAVITGANAGLGYQLSVKLSRMGARVVMACRSRERAESARQLLLAEVPDARARIILLDISSPESINEFVAQFTDRIGQLDILINNAGIVAVPLSRNGTGHEMQLATNYLGPFALTGKLLPLIPDTVGSRIVNVGSLAHRFGKLPLDDLNWERGRYNKWRAYARSKIAMVAYTLELNRRLQQRGSPVIAVGAHPGFAATEIGKDNALMNPKNPVGRWINGKLEARVPSAEQAVEPILHATCGEDVRGGDYYGPGGLLEIGGPTDKARVNPRAYNREIARQLWSTSEALTGVSYLPDESEMPSRTESGNTATTEIDMPFKRQSL